jgi:vacuolar iron transporter family protein
MPRPTDRPPGHFRSKTLAFHAPQMRPTLGAMRHPEAHRTSSIGWLRAAVLGANDGIVSTGSLLLGVVMAGANPTSIFITGLAGLLAGATSMAAGEYVSVSSQADSEQAELAKERRELQDSPEQELLELTGIYERRGLSRELAAEVAMALTAHNAFEAHRRDELGLTDELAANPIQAALASAFSFAVGAVFPLIFTLVCPRIYVPWALPALCLLTLTALGVLSARQSGAPSGRATVRVTLWGAIAMGLTALAGALFGAGG